MSIRLLLRRRSAEHVTTGGSDTAGRAERRANAIDHYSLVLQLVQVFPVVTGVTVAVVATAWVARALAGVFLLVGSLWAIRLERSAKDRGARRDASAQDPQVRAVVLAQPTDEISILIQVRSSVSPSAPGRRRRRRLLRHASRAVSGPPIVTGAARPGDGEGLRPGDPIATARGLRIHRENPSGIRSP